MAWSFGDGMDLYAAPADMATGYWDSVTAGSASFLPGRFSGSRALNPASATFNAVKNSGTNDAVHHFAVAFQQTTAISGSTKGVYLQLLDGVTAQVSVVFQSDGSILLASGGPTGTVLATYAGAFPVASTWYHFELEVVINNTTGSFKVRKNGNSTEDHSTTGIDTQNSANAYANSLKIGHNASTTQYFDDLFWQSSAAAGTWLGDIRCYTRMPVSDASVTWSRTPTSNTQTPFTNNATMTPGTTGSYYVAFTAAYDGTVSTVTLSANAGYTGNVKCSAFNSSGSAPTTLLASATTLVNPVTGSNTITFPSPFSVTKGVQYWIGFATDSASGVWSSRSASGSNSTTIGYTAFPAASPTIASGNTTVPSTSVTISITTNNCVVSEAQQDATTSYVYSSTVNDADLYGIAAIASTPATVIATTVRAYMQKSDAGTRTAAVQLKSGSTTVASSTLTLSSSGWQWAWRMDLTDPATGTAWTAAAVNAATIGPKVIA